jgi:hypothetical protein
MRSIAIPLLLACCLPLASAQTPTLREILQKAGIPGATFSKTELDQHVDAGDGRNGSFTYLTYLRVENQNNLQGPLQFVRYDSQTHRVFRSSTSAYDDAMCCGSPLGFDFTEHYLLASFHDNPSANTVIVTDKQFHYKTTLYGFEIHPVGPDRVVFIEDEVHFAPAHPGRLVYTDLATGAALELYPSGNDPLRAAFAKIHEQHMPAKADCEKNNDPCDPDYYDEDITVLRTEPDMVRFKVHRAAAHPWLTEDGDPDGPADSAVYTIKLGPSGWKYCAVEGDSPDRICELNLPVIPVEPDTFTPHSQGSK